MHTRLKTATALAALALATGAKAQVTLNSDPDFQGLTINVNRRGEPRV